MSAELSGKCKIENKKTESLWKPRHIRDGLEVELKYKVKSGAEVKAYKTGFNCSGVLYSFQVALS